MKSATKVDMPQSEAAAAQSAKVMETSGSPNYQNGDKSNTTGEKVLSEINERLANLLVLYNQAGGKMKVIELPEGIFETGFGILLPAEKQKDGTFSLMPE